MSISGTARQRGCGAVGLIVITVALGARADWNPHAFHEATAEDGSSPLTANDQGFFQVMQRAIAADDKAWLAAHMTFPLYAPFHGQHTLSAAEFGAHYRDIVTLDVKDAILEQEPEKLFKNSHGICAGEGCVLWFGYTVANGQYKYRITTINTPVLPPPPAPPTSGCNLQGVDWKNESYPAGDSFEAFRLRSGTWAKHYDSSHSLSVRFVNVTYGDIEGKGGQQAFVRLAVVGQGETVPAGAAIYVFEGDPHCAPRSVGSVLTFGNPQQPPGKLVDKTYLDHDGTRWVLINHKLQSAPAPSTR
jgi:hypothetical protein